MGSELYKSTPKDGTGIETVEIRIEIDMGTDDTLDDWADTEDRSKRSQIAHVVKEVVRAYRSDPFILHRIALMRSGNNAAPAMAHA